MKYTEEEISKLQRNLELIRRAGGWTAEEFGALFGITKQSVRNLEKGPPPAMTKMQYIAIRTVLENEAANNKDNELLGQILNLVFRSDSMSEEELSRAKNAVTYAAGAQKIGLSKAETVKGIAQILGTALSSTFFIAGALLSSSDWLAKIIHDKDR